MDVLLLRFFERITVVLIGGMAIYLGFRLFLAVPELKESDGKVELPWNISVVMTRVGPGVFFALFGIAAVSLALYRPLEVQVSGAGRAAEEATQRFSYAAAPALGDRTARADARALLRREMARLNAIPRLLRADLPEYEQDSVKRTLAQVKFLLMKPLWGEADEGFGDVAMFEEWVQAGGRGPLPAQMEGALALYHYGEKEGASP
jgi:hypothetical protein